MDILLVDDSKEHLSIVEDIFRVEGYNVRTVSDAFSALKELENYKFDLVVTDLNIPVLDGHHLIQIVKSKYPNIPIIVLSAYVDDPEELKELGVYAVLSKPPNVNELLDVVENAINDLYNAVSFVFTHTDLKRIREEVTKRMIKLALRKNLGSQVKAAKMLKISRQSLIRYMREYGL